MNSKYNPLNWKDSTTHLVFGLFWLIVAIIANSTENPETIAVMVPVVFGSVDLAVAVILRQTEQIKEQLNERKDIN